MQQAHCYIGVEWWLVMVSIGRVIRKGVVIVRLYDRIPFTISEMMNNIQHVVFCGILWYFVPTTPGILLERQENGKGNLPMGRWKARENLEQRNQESHDGFHERCVLQSLTWCCADRFSVGTFVVLLRLFAAVIASLGWLGNFGVGATISAIGSPSGMAGTFLQKNIPIVYHLNLHWRDFPAMLDSQTMSNKPCRKPSSALHNLPPCSAGCPLVEFRNVFLGWSCATT